MLPVAGLVIAAAAWEMRTSTLQSRYFSAIGREIGWTVEPGPSARIVFPESGPMDERLGYTAIPRVVDTLGARGFAVSRQARVSERFVEVVEQGLFPPWREKTQGGLTLTDRRGDVYHRSPSPMRVYESFDSIPEVVWRTLVHIENRDFLDPDRPRDNPAVEWDRFLRAIGEMGLRTLGSDRNVPGGSTLATQLEKFRHSPEGRTGSAGDKIRQMLSASTRAYLDGPRTIAAQERIVRDYLNSVPLAAQVGHGEVVGTADGLWAWYGISFDDANRLLRGRGLEPDEGVRRAEVYRAALSLIIAHRRPSWYLARDEGRTELSELADVHLRMLADAGVIPANLADAALEARPTLLERAPPRPPVSFVERKAANQVRAHLLGLLGVPQLYDLDRYDVEVATSVDMTWQLEVAALLQRLGEPEAVRELGFAVDRILARGDPEGVVYTFTLLETTQRGNAVRIQTDNFDGPLSLSQAGRLELGSTAKLRTLVTYLEVVAELHDSLSALPPDSLAALDVAPRDVLTAWVRDRLARRPGEDLPTILGAAMDRRYSASTGERFVTGGGVQTFSNFDRTYDGSTLTVREAFRQSVNLPFVRMMRDIVHYHMYLGPGTTARILESSDDPARSEYLARFADREGSQFLRDFHSRYRELPVDSLLPALVSGRGLTPTRVAWALRSAEPDMQIDRFSTLMQESTPDADLTLDALTELYRRTDPAPWDLNDQGYLARIHPLEVWLVRYLREHPGAGLSEVLGASVEVRQEVYQWLFRTQRRNAQDQRIRTILELEAFQRIHAAWRRHGYPFGTIVPSYGTAIGSSGDRPLALAELVGIIVNDGVRYPVTQVDAVRLAPDSPFETVLERGAVAGEAVLPPEVAAVVREAMVDVVENGTGRRARGAVVDAAGAPLVVGGKTGTGDNRFQVYGTGGRLIESRVVNRTATLVFFLGDRHFGVVTAYVPGEAASAYDFTSGLPAQVLRTLGPALSPLNPSASAEMVEGDEGR
jgi:membrane peptidoglycan carboxypeptidase